MSQLVRAVMAEDTGERTLQKLRGFSPLFQDVFSKKEYADTVYDKDMCISKRYKIGVTIGSQVKVSDFDEIGDQLALEKAIERTKRSIVEAIFGEFRSDLYQIDNALYDGDFNKARNLLTALEKKMFEV